MNLRIIPLLTLILPAMAAPARGQEFAREVVVAQEGHAAQVGAAILEQGGNAIDAAVATAFALAVTLPEAGNLGGGGFIVAFLAEQGRVVTVDFRETAPGRATERMYLDEQGKLLPGHRFGPRAAGVPGTPAGLALAHRNWGKLPWPDLVRPAAKLAREGFPLSEHEARALNRELDPHAPGASRRLAGFPSSVAAYRKPDGSPWKAGDRLVQPDLAATLEILAAHGPEDFYRGEIARKFVAAVERDGGLIDAADLDAYRAHERPPVRTTFRGHEIYGMGPPSSGGVVLLTMLNLLEPFDLKADGRDSPLTLHRITEAMRRAYYIRATRLADPDFVPIPTEQLVSKDFARELARTYREDRATPSAALADFPIAGADAEPEHTTHLSTIDAAGNAVALTYTLEDSYGSRYVVPGLGFLLNNEMGDFNLIPGRTDTEGRIGTPPNRIAPGKRMLSSQAPTLALKDGKVALVTGSPGGRRIPNTVLWVVLNALEFGAGDSAIVAAPRTHHAWFPDVLELEGNSWPAATIDALRALGHTVRRSGTQGCANTILVHPDGRLLALPDTPRPTSAAAGR